MTTKCPLCGGGRAKRTRINHRYAESGLDNVTLVGASLVKCGECGEEAVEILRAEAVHDAIAEALLRREPRFSGREARFLRKWMGLDVGKMAWAMCVGSMTVDAWEAPKGWMTMEQDRLMRMLCAQRLQEKRGVVEQGVSARMAGVRERREKAGKLEIRVRMDALAEPEVRVPALLLHLFWEKAPGPSDSGASGPSGAGSWRNGEVSAHLGDDMEPPTEREMQDVMHAAKMEFARLRRKRKPGAKARQTRKPGNGKGEPNT